MDFQPGSIWLFKTVNDYVVGRVVQSNGILVELEDAAWIPDTGRFHQCLANASFTEVEPAPKGTRVRVVVLSCTTIWEMKGVQLPLSVK